MTARTKNAKCLWCEHDIPHDHAMLQRALAENKEAQRRARLKHFRVSWFAPALGRRVELGHSVRSDTKKGAIAQVKAIHRRRRSSWLSRFGASKQLTGLTNYAAEQIIRNPELTVRPFFCADCERPLDAKARAMADGRVVCSKCGRAAVEQHQRKSQQRMFEAQSELFENPKRNIEMGFYAGGSFHPIRASKDYNEFRAGDFDEPKAKGQRRLERESRQMREHYEREEKRLAQKFSKQHKSLSQWIRRIGGIAPHPRDEQHSGEMESLRSRGRKQGFGTSGLINKSNTLGTKRASPEYVMDAANVEGYRDEQGRKFSNIGDFLAAVADDAGGKQKFFKLSDLNEYEYANPKMKKSSRKVAKVQKNATRAGAKSGTVKCLDGKGGRLSCSNRVPEARVLHVCDRCLAKAQSARSAQKNAGKDARAPKKNLFGLDRQSRIKRAKKRARVASAKASLLEAKEQLKRARKNPLGKQSFEYLVNTRDRGYIPGVIQGRSAKAVVKSLRDAYKDLGVKSVRLWKLKKHQNPGALDTAVKLAAVLGGAETVGKLLRGSSKKGPGRRPVGPRYYLFVGADRRGNHVDTKPEAVAAARSLANQTGGAVTVRQMKGTKLAVVKTVKPQVAKKHRNSSPEPRKRNSADGSIFQDFTGRPSKNVTTGYVAADAPKVVDQLGDVVQVTIQNGKGPVTIGSKQDGTARTIMGEVKRFHNGAVKLCAIEKNGKRRFVVGVRATDRARLLKRFPIANGIFNYGPAAEVVYRARKPHLYGHNRELTFYHLMGEEGARRPSLMQKNGCPSLVYGGYEIKSEGIRN